MQQISRPRETKNHNDIYNRRRAALAWCCSAPEIMVSSGVGQVGCTSPVWVSWLCGEGHQLVWFPVRISRAQVPCRMAISNCSSKQPMSASPFRSTKLNSGLTVMSSLTLSVSILATGYVKSPKKIL